MPMMSEGEQAEALDYIGRTEKLLSNQAKGGFSQSDLREILKHILNVCKRLAGDRAPLVE